MKPVTPLCVASPRICCCCHTEGFPSPNISMETTPPHPAKNTLAGEVVSLLSQDHRLPAFWYRHMIWPTVSQLRLENWGLKPWGDLCRNCSQECCPSLVPSPGAFLLVCWDAALLLSGASWCPRWIPSGWISFHCLFCVQYKLLFSRCAFILKRLWSCYVTLFSWDPSLPHVLTAAPILLRTES